jgi:hypothetical protein
MVRLRSVDVLSFAKIYGIFHMAFGVVVAPLARAHRPGRICHRPRPTEILHDWRSYLRGAHHFSMVCSVSSLAH